LLIPTPIAVIMLVWSHCWGDGPYYIWSYHSLLRYYLHVCAFWSRVSACWWRAAAAWPPGDHFVPTFQTPPVKTGKSPLWSL